MAPWHGSSADRRGSRCLPDDNRRSAQCASNGGAGAVRRAAAGKPGAGRQPGHTRARGARTTLVLGPDSLGPAGRRLRNLPPSRLRLFRRSRPLYRHQRRGTRRRADVCSRPARAAGQAQQPDGVERRLQRPHAWRGCGAGRRTDVLGSQGAQSRSAGPGADQGARGDARRRVSRAPGRAVGRRATERHRRVPGVVRSRLRREQASERTEPRTRAGSVPAHADRGQLPIRSLHARRHQRTESRTAARHGALRINRLRQLPQRPDVLRLRRSRAGGARQPEAAGIGQG